MPEPEESVNLEEAAWRAMAFTRALPPGSEVTTAIFKRRTDGRWGWRVTATLVAGSLDSAEDQTDDNLRRVVYGLLHSGLQAARKEQREKEDGDGA